MPNEEMDRRALPQSPDVATRKILIAVGGYLGFVGLAMVAIFFYVKADAPPPSSCLSNEPIPSPASKLPRTRTSPMHCRANEVLCLGTAGSTEAEVSQEYPLRRPSRSSLPEATAVTILWTSQTPRRSRTSRDAAMRVLALTVLMAVWSSSALSALTEQQLKDVALAPPEGARAPATLEFRDMDGNETTLGDAIDGRPTLLLPADFTCTQICGPALTIVQARCSRRDCRQDATTALSWSASIRATPPTCPPLYPGQIGGPGIGPAEASIDHCSAARLSAPYRSPNDAIAHPAAFVTLAPDGHVSRGLSSLALQPLDIRLALLEAGDSVADSGRIALLCYGFDRGARHLHPQDHRHSADCRRIHGCHSWPPSSD